MNIVFQIDGGIGKNIMATAVCKAIKKTYPKDKLIVVAGYPEVFTNNPHVDRIVHFGGTQYFFKDYVEGQKIRALVHNPYHDSQFINHDAHCIKAWVEMYGMKYEGEQPELFLTKRERDHYLQAFKPEKPLMIVQTNGGAEGQNNAYSWARDIPQATAQKVVDAFKDDYTVLQIRRANQPILNGVGSLTASFREIASVIELSEKRLFMDSFAQHTASALGLPSTVCWIANNPLVFGYSQHDNIVAYEETQQPDLRTSYLSKYDIAGNPLEFPYMNEDEIFSAEEIIKSLKAQTTPKRKDGATGLPPAS